jgi:2-phospho-L-lactate guanylyltransferase (CobY/MobA/RfbA family)
LVSLRRDVDTVADLLEARQLGTGPATTRVLAELDGG